MVKQLISLPKIPKWLLQTTIKSGKKKIIEGVDYSGRKDPLYILYVKIIVMIRNLLEVAFENRTVWCSQ